MNQTSLEVNSNNNNIISTTNKVRDLKSGIFISKKIAMLSSFLVVILFVGSIFGTYMVSHADPNIALFSSDKIDKKELVKKCQDLLCKNSPSIESL